jgi:hypothetical protein
MTMPIIISVAFAALAGAEQLRRAASVLIISNWLQWAHR